MRRLLVTGGAGFIGSNFIQYILKRRNDIELLLNLDLLTYAGNLENLLLVNDDRRYVFVRGDIRNKILVNELFDRHNFDTVVHFAAESHVDRSIADPEIFFSTNIMGTQVLLDAALHHWNLCPKDKHSREYLPETVYLQVSTDEVYGTLGETGLFTENSPILPNSPYSASKASADLLVRAYSQTYGMPVNITRCSNNYGPFQFPEKLIPLILNSALHDRPIPVYGDGMQIRDWLHVEDHCSAILAVLDKGERGEIYNIGGNNERTNIEIVKMVLRNLGKSEDLVSYIEDRPCHDRRYAIDNSKITSRLKWAPVYDFEKGINKTIEWYLSHTGWMDRIISRGYLEYYNKMYS